MTVEGLHLVVDQPHAAAGVAAINNSFDGLHVLNNVIDTTGTGGSLSGYSMGIAAVASGSGTAPSVTIQGNTILPEVSGTTIVSILKRAIWVSEAQGTIGGSTAADGNTLAGSYQDLLDAFARGATTIENNTLYGAGVTITEPNASAPIDILSNDFAPVAGVDDAALLIKHNYNATSPVTIQGNTFAVQTNTIGVLSTNSLGVNVTGNMFAPGTDPTTSATSTNTVDIYVDTYIPSGSQPAPYNPNEISITGNTFDASDSSTATAINIANHNAGAASPDYASISIGGGGAAKNTFDGNLQSYINLLAPTAGVSYSGDVYSTPHASAKHQHRR